MLVLDGRESETIHIGQNIELRVIRISDKIVRIGFTAPKDVEIWRNKIFKKRQQQQKEQGNV